MTRAHMRAPYEQRSLKELNMKYEKFALNHEKISASGAFSIGFLTFRDEMIGFRKTAFDTRFAHTNSNS